MTLAAFTQRVAKLAIDNSPTILTTIGVVGSISTAFLTGRASFQAADIIRLKEADDEERGQLPDGPRELLKSRIELVWRLYVPPVSMGVATIFCIVGANRVGARRAAGLAAAYSITEKTFDEYKKKVVEKIGEKKEEAVRDEIAQDRVNATYIEDVKLVGLEEGELCYDQFSDRYFKNSVEGIRGAENDLNFMLIHHGFASLADFYRALEMDAPPFSENVGWNSDRKLEVRISATVAHGVKPVIVMDFKNEPLPDYGRFH